MRSMGLAEIPSARSLRQLLLTGIVACLRSSQVPESYATPWRCGPVGLTAGGSKGSRLSVREA